jgi:arsenate reductase
MKILFMCLANSARSQLAEGLAKKILGPGFKIQSAGLMAAGVNPFAIHVLDELGIDSTKQWSKPVDLIDPLSVEVVIMLTEENVCPPSLAHARLLHWPINDPTARGKTDNERLQAFRECRDVISKKIQEFAVQVKVSPPSP